MLNTLNTHLPSRVTPFGTEYFTSGRGQDVIVAFAHGWRDSAYGWKWVAEAMNQLPRSCDVSLIAVQRRIVGRGSEPSARLLDAYAAQMVDAIHDAASPAARVILVGHAMGAQIAELAATTLLHRLAGLALVTPVPLKGVDLPGATTKAFRALCHEPDRIDVSLARAGLALERSDDAFLRMVLATSEESFDASFETLNAWMGGHPAGAHPSAIAAPTLVVGTDDTLMPLNVLKTAVLPRFANAKLAELHGAGHFPHLERPAELAEHINTLVRAACMGLSGRH
jgi:esterase